MINNSFKEKWERLRWKQQDVRFVTQLQAGMNCSPFEAKAILNCVYEVYQPYFNNSASVKPGQILFEVVSVENFPKGKLSFCQMKAVILTLDSGPDDLEVRERAGVIGLRRHRLERIANEAFQQGGLLTVEDIANRLLNCGERTVTRDIKALKNKGVCLPLRSTVKDMERESRNKALSAIG